MPLFCRHNRFEQNCPICRKPEPAGGSRPRARPAPRSTGSRPGRRATVPTSRVRVHQADRAADDGYRSPLVPGIKSSADARRLAEELAASAARLGVLASDPPGLYGEIAAEPDPEEASWLAFLTAYLGPLEGEDPFAGVRLARVAWATGELPRLDEVPVGPRTAHDHGRGTATVAAYRGWAARAGSQAAAFRGDDSWAPERRFGRVFERLSLPGLHRGARFDLLVTLGRLGVHPLKADALHLGSAPDDPVTVAAKRVFGIGDPLLLERRAADLADAAEVPLDALDLALWNWGRGPEPRSTGGVAAAAATEPPGGALALALGV